MKGTPDSGSIFGGDEMCACMRPGRIFRALHVDASSDIKNCNHSRNRVDAKLFEGWFVIVSQRHMHEAEPTADSGPSGHAMALVIRL